MEGTKETERGRERLREREFIRGAIKLYLHVLVNPCFMVYLQRCRCTHQRAQTKDWSTVLMEICRFFLPLLREWIQRKTNIHTFNLLKKKTTAFLTNHKPRESLLRTLLRSFKVERINYKQCCGAKHIPSRMPSSSSVWKSFMTSEQQEMHLVRSARPNLLHTHLT